MNLTTFSKYKESLHDLKQLILRYYYIALLGLLSFTVLIPVSNIMLSQISIFNINFTHDQLKFRFFLENLTPVIAIWSIVYGVIVGLSLFRFINDKKETAFFFSMGITSTKLYANRLIVGLIFLKVAIVIPMTISFILNISALGVTPGLVASFFASTLSLLMLAALGFLLTSIACTLAGTIIEAIVYSGIFLSAQTLVTYLLNGLFKQLLLGNTYGEFTYTGTKPIYENLIWSFSSINPITSLYKIVETNSFFLRGLIEDIPPPPDFKSIIIWFILLLVLTIVELKTLKKRKLENTEISGKNTGINMFISSLITWTVFVVMINIIWKFSQKTALISAVTSLIVTYLVLEFIVFKKKDNLKRHMLNLLAQLSISILSLVILLNGGLGYSRKIAPIKDIENIELSYVGSPNYMNNDVSGFRSGSGYYMTKDYTYVDEDDKARVIALHEKIIDQGQLQIGSAEDDFSKSVVPYDIKIKYKLKNGKEQIRYYNKASLQTLNDFLDLDKTYKVKDEIEKSILEEASVFSQGEIYLSDSYYSNIQLLKLDYEKRQEFLKALAKDVLEQTTDQRYFPLGETIGAIMFTENGESDIESFTYNLGNSVTYLTNEFTNTIGFLEKFDLMKHFEFNSSIEEILVQKYDPFSGINKLEAPTSPYFLSYKADSPDEFIRQDDFGKKTIFKDKDQISQLMAVCKNHYFLSPEGYLVAMKLKNREEYIYEYLPKPLAPDFIKQRFD